MNFLVDFQGGRADQAQLELARAPRFLRVVVDGRDQVDALDQLDDQPRIDETVHAYRRVFIARGFACVRSSRRKPSGGRFAVATYAPIDKPPAVQVLRDQAEWAKWVQLIAAIRYDDPVDDTLC